MQTRFKDWRIDGYTATSPDWKYKLWIANGFFAFADHDPRFPRETLLKGVGIISRWRIWRELRAERLHRARDFLQS